MRKLLFFVAFVVAFCDLNAQVITADRAFVRDNLQPPQDTIKNPVRLGEIRTRASDSAIFISISLAGPKRWAKVSGSGGGILVDENNYTSSVSFNAGTSVLTLTRVGLPNLTANIPIPVYNGSETKVQSGTGGVSVTGAGTVASPYVISVPVYDGSETKLSAGYGLVITGSGTIAAPYTLRSDTLNMQTRAMGKKQIDSLAALTKKRQFTSPDTSIEIVIAPGATEDTVKIRSLDSLVDVVIYSPDNTVIINTNDNGDSISLTVPAASGGGGDNWGSQIVVRDNSLTGDGTALNALAVRRAWLDSIIVLSDTTGVRSVGLVMPSAFTVVGSPITTTGSFTVTANGTTAQYIRGDGSLATFPTIPTYDGSETKLSQGSNITITGSGTVASPYVISSTASGGTGTVTSVGVTMPPAFNVSSSPVTTSGTIAVTGAGTTSQYVRGDGSLATFPTIPTYDGSETKLSQGTNVTITGLGTVASPYVINAAAGGGGSGTVTSVGLQMPSGFTVTGSPVTVSGTLSVGTSLSGMLYGTGSGIAAASITSPLQYSAGTLSILQASAIQNGFLSLTDWATFNNKQSAVQWRDEGVNIGSNGATTVVNITGGGATATHSAGVTTINIPSPPAQDGNNFTTSTAFTDGLLTTARSGLSNLTASISTSVVPEGSRLYYTDARARGAMGITTSGNSGASTYNPATGVYNIPNYTLAGLGGEPIIASGTSAQYWNGLKQWVTLNTAAVPESGNLYYTDARSRLAISTNGLPLTYNSTTGVLGINVGNGSQSGYITSVDWNTFNGKQSPVQYQDEGINAGSAGANTIIDFIGGGVTASSVGNKLTVSIPGGGAGADGNNYPTAMSFSAGTLTLSRDGLSDLTATINTAGVPESGNLYFTNARARTAIGLTTAGTSGAATYSTATGVLNIPNYTLAGLGGEPIIASGTSAQYWNGLKQWVTLNTATVPESGNLYYTDARARASISATSPLQYNSGTGVLSILQSSAIQNGFLSSTDWSTFNAKQQAIQAQDEGIDIGSLGATATLNFTGGGVTATHNAGVTTVNIPSATSVQYQDEGVNAGTLGGVGTVNFTGAGVTATHNAGTLTVTIPGGAGADGNNFTTATAFTDGVLTTSRSGLSPDLTASISTSVVPEGTRQYFTNARARSAISLTTTGSSGASTYSSSTGVLNIPNYTLSGLGGVPTTRTLTINGTTQDLSANRTWNVGTVTSVGATGGSGISVTGSPITSSGSFTISNTGVLSNVAGTGIAVSGATGNVTITNTAPDQVVGLTAGTGMSITGTYPNFTISNTRLGTVTSVGLATGSSGTDVNVSGSPVTSSGNITLNIPSASSVNRGALTPADWTKFNNKQSQISLTTAGSSGPATFVAKTGSTQPDSLNIPNYTLAGLGGVPTTRTLTINGVAQDLSANRSWSVGTVTSVGATAGTGISITGSPVTSSGSFTVTNTGVTSLVAGTGMSVSGATGSVTVTNTAPDRTVAIASGTGISATGTYPNFTVTNTAPDQVVSVTGANGISVTGTYPNFTVSGSGINGLFSSKSTISASSPFVVASSRMNVTGSYELSNNVLKIGNASDDNLRTITVNATFYAAQGSFTPGNYTLVGTLPSGFEPTGIVQFALPDNVANTGNPATAFYQGDLNVPIRNICLMSGVDGYIDPINRNIYVRIGSVSQYALYDDPVHGAQNVVVIPINVTYFRNPGT